MLSFLYLASMVLKRHHDQGSPPEDLPLVEWSCRSLLYRAQEQLHDFLRNFPNRPLAALMRLLMFPRGRTYFAPSDRLGARLADGLMTPGPMRDRLCEEAWREAGTRVDGKDSNPLHLLELALRSAVEAEPLEKRLRVDGIRTGRITAVEVAGQIDEAVAIGLLNAAEGELLRRHDALIMSVIHVDDFAPDEIGTRPAGPDAGAARH